MELLQGAVDCHIHACPHINRRSLNVLDATRQAAAAGMKAIGLMDNFSNSSGIAALAMAELHHLGVEVFGGIILEPPAGGVTAEAVKTALLYGYGPGTGGRFVSMPTHHTRHIALKEGRSARYVEECFHIPLRGELPDPLPAILDLIAEKDVVLNTGHLSGEEAVRLTEEAKKRGVERIMVPSTVYGHEVIREAVSAGAYAEFSFFFLTHATQVGLTHVDEERHMAESATLSEVASGVRAATPERTILSGDLGVFVLPPPVEGFREFLLLMESVGFSEREIRVMSSTNPAALFRVG
jgi:hypothetical protein